MWAPVASGKVRQCTPSAYAHATREHKLIRSWSSRGRCERRMRLPLAIAQRMPRSRERRVMPVFHNDELRIKLFGVRSRSESGHGVAAPRRRGRAQADAAGSCCAVPWWPSLLVSSQHAAAWRRHHTQPRRSCRSCSVSSIAYGVRFMRDCRVPRGQLRGTRTRVQPRPHSPLTATREWRLLSATLRIRWFFHPRMCDWRVRPVGASCTRLLGSSTPRARRGRFTWA